jgi:hypothetical protein
MSRHHILPPIVYVPQPKPKKIENRKSRIQMRSAGSVEDAGDVEETYEPVEAGRLLPAGGRSALETFTAIEGADGKIPSTTGRLSENTLKALLFAQELKQDSID